MVSGVSSQLKYNQLRTNEIYHNKENMWFDNDQPFLINVTSSWNYNFMLTKSQSLEKFSILFEYTQRQPSHNLW